jgi:predicted DNA-binding protein (UPF0251 family)
MSDIIEKLADIDISYLNKNNVAKVIRFDEDFEKRPTHEQIEYLIGLSSAMNEAVKVAYKERDALILERDQAVKEKEVAERLMNIHKQNLVQGLTEANANTQQANKALEKALAESKRYEQLYADCKDK